MINGQGSSKVHSYVDFDCKSLTSMIALIEEILAMNDFIEQLGQANKKVLESLGDLVEQLWQKYRNKGYDCLYAYADPEGSPLFATLKQLYQTDKNITPESLSLLGKYSRNPLYDRLPFMSQHEAYFEKIYTETRFNPKREKYYRELLFYQCGYSAVERFNYFVWCKKQSKESECENENENVDPALAQELVDLLLGLSFSGEHSTEDEKRPMAHNVPRLVLLNKSHDGTSSMSPRVDMTSITPRSANRSNYEKIRLKLEEDDLSSSSDSQIVYPIWSPRN